MELTSRLISAYRALFRPMRDAAFEGGEQKGSTWENIFLRCLDTTLFEGKVTNPYQDYGWVYVAVREIAVAVSQIPIKIMQGKDTEEKGDFARIFQSPNPQLNSYQLKEAIVSLLALDGNAFVVPWSEKQGRTPDQLWVFGRSSMRPVYKSSGHVEAWEYQGKQKQTFPADEVVHLKLYNPYDGTWGLSPVTAARLAMDTDYAAQQYNKSMLQNSATPSGVVTVDAPLNESQLEVLKKQWEARHKGEKKAGNLAILQKGMDYKPIALSQKDMEFLEARRYNREEVLAIWQVPKSIVGITDDLNYATLMGQKRIFWQDTIMPYVRLIQDGFNSHFFPRFAPGLRLEFDLSNVPELHEDYTARVDNAVKLANMGFPINDINDKLELGLERVPWGDVHLVQATMIPADMAGTIDLTPWPPQNNNNPPPPPRAPELLSKVTQNEEYRFKRWVDMLRVQGPLEKQFRSKIQRYFFEQRNLVLALLTKNAKDVGDYRLFLWDKENEKLVEIVEPLYRRAVVAGSNLIADMLATESFTLRNPLVDKNVLDRCHKITAINDTIRGRIAQSLDDGLKVGESIMQLSDRVGQEYLMARHRANTIARTETAGAVNDGEYLMMESEGVEQHEWLSARDGEVRDDHQEEDGNVARLYDPFPVTGLFYPHDPIGPPEQVINCRCTTLPIV